MKEELVSIITPCYNGEKYVENFLKSILKQTYSNIELIFVDDGSTDRTKEIVAEYEKKFKEQGYCLIYLYQKNKGQAAAVNTGLLEFHGKYLAWIDSDDILYPESIRERVEFLQSHTEYGFVLSQGICVNENNLDSPTGVLKRQKPKGEDKLFEDLIYCTNVVFCPGTILVTKNALLKAVPKQKIYESREGQNWQLMLPLAYTSKCGYIEKPLFKCVEHQDSHSRQKRTKKEKIEREKNFIELLQYTIENIPNMSREEREKWKKESKIYHEKIILWYLFTSGEIKKTRNLIKDLKSDGVKNIYGELCMKLFKALYKKIMSREK